MSPGNVIIETLGQDMKRISLLIAITLIFLSNQNAQQTQILPLGTFHFNFPNLDVVKIEDDDQIDVLDEQYQDEINEIVKQIARFKPTIIAIEREPFRQSKYDSLYHAYLDGNHELTRSEEQQIGFRLAKMLGIKKLHCVDEAARHYADIQEVVYGTDNPETSGLMDFFYNNPDTGFYHTSQQVYKTEGIMAELKRLNSDEQLKQSLGDYFIAVFKYEAEEKPFFGPDFTSGWWFNRNLRIFRNIQRINPTPEDRILLIYGCGHMNILNIMFDASPEYELVKVQHYLD